MQLLSEMDGEEQGERRVIVRRKGGWWGREGEHFGRAGPAEARRRCCGRSPARRAQGSPARDVLEAHLAVADEGEPAIRNGDAMGVAAEILQHLPTFPEAQQQRCIPEDNLLMSTFQTRPLPDAPNLAT
jgi:hypothetical protein